MESIGREGMPLLSNSTLKNESEADFPTVNKKYKPKVVVNVGNSLRKKPESQLLSDATGLAINRDKPTSVSC